MPRILSIETSTAICSASIHEDGRVIVVSEIHEDQSHASKLAVLIDHVLQISQTKPGDLSAVAVSAGPGSYTGLRIGVSTAKGICFAHNIPLISVNSLEVMTWRVQKKKNLHGLFCPLIDARRMEAYCCLFSPEMEIVEPVQAKVMDASSFGEVLELQKVNFFGNAVAKLADVIRHPNAVFIHDIYPSAAELGDLAWKKLQSGRFEDLVHYEPVYLKEFLVKKSTKLDSVLNK